MATAALPLLIPLTKGTDKAVHDGVSQLSTTAHLEKCDQERESPREGHDSHVSVDHKLKRVVRANFRRGYECQNWAGIIGGTTGKALPKAVVVLVLGSSLSSSTEWRNPGEMNPVELAGGPHMSFAV